MERMANDVMAEAKALMDKGEKLDYANDLFNKVFNESLNGKGKRDVLLFFIACVNMKQDYDALAILLFQEALKENPEFIEALNNLGFMYKKVGKFEESKKCFENVLKLLPKIKDTIPITDQADYYSNLGALYIANGTPEDAINYFNQASKISDHNALNKWNRSLAYLEQGNYEKGFNDYEYGDRSEKGDIRNYGRDQLPYWDGMANQTVIVYGEQGIGDEIMFASILPDAMKHANIIFDAHPRLQELFRLNFPDLHVYGTRKEKSSKVAWSKYEKFDSKIAIGSLAKFYRKKEEDFPRAPYLKADPKKIEKYQKRFKEMGDLPKIGISWKGGTKITSLHHRMIQLIKFKEIIGSIDADFISLQYHKDAHQDVNDFQQATGLTLHHFSEELQDYDETAALVSNLDLVISVPQSVVHLAGALGITTWQLTPKRAMWQMGVYGRDMPWYSSVKSYWQPHFGDWDSVLKTVKEDLCRL